MDEKTIQSNIYNKTVKVRWNGAGVHVRKKFCTSELSERGSLFSYMVPGGNEGVLSILINTY